MLVILIDGFCDGRIKICFENLRIFKNFYRRRGFDSLNKISEKEILLANILNNMRINAK